MPAKPRLYYWTEITPQQAYASGIERVVRNLGAGLEEIGVDVVPVRWDAARQAIGPLDQHLRERLTADHGPVGSTFDPATDVLSGAWLLIPEIPPAVMMAPEFNPVQIARANGMRTAAMIYDIIPAKFPELHSSGMVGVFRNYFASFSNTDLTIAPTAYVANDLRVHLTARELSVPTIAVVALAGEFIGAARAHQAGPLVQPTEALRLLAVGLWRPRKNYPQLLRALRCARERSPRAITLTIVGSPGAFPDLNAEVYALAAELSDVHIKTSVTDAELAQLYAEHHATVFPSWEEGFGLPIVESLWFGVPCICHNGSAIAEVARGGGTLMLDMLDEEALVQGLCRLSTDQRLWQQLACEARERPTRTWRAYSEAILSTLLRAQ